MWRYLILLSVMAVLIAACGGTDTANETSTSTDATTSTTEAATTSTPAASESVGVKGTSNCNCSFSESRTEGDAEAISGTCVCISNTSDPRVSGRETVPLTLWLFPNLEPEVHWFEYHDATLTNDLGTWEQGEGFGSEFITEDGSVYTTGYLRYVGTGAFDGLVYEIFHGQAPGFPPADDPDESYKIYGWIEPDE